MGVHAVVYIHTREGNLVAGNVFVQLSPWYITLIDWLHINGPHCARR